ncbi:VirB4 family type IV secretion/conjugal transfer ATPase, partial [Wolbachia pipientis]
MQQQVLQGQGKSASIEKIDLDFIPYACHYDEETVLTKQGELLKIIKLEDYVSPNNYSDLRTEIRKSIARNIDTQYCTVWIHTVRKKHKISLQWHETKDFSDRLHLARLHRLTGNKLQYINELYIVILFNNCDERIGSSLFLHHIKDKHASFLQRKHKDLEAITNLMHIDLQPFGAKKLGFRSHQGTIYSEMMEFLYYIITFTRKEYPISETDLSQSVKDLQIAFGFNTFQTIFNEKRRFGSIFSIKEYKEIPLGNINKCLQLDSEMIITEVIIFTSNNKAIQDFKQQINILQASEDNELIQKYGIIEIIESEKAHGINFCQQKFIFTIFEDNKEKLAQR